MNSTFHEDMDFWVAPYTLEISKGHLKLSTERKRNFSVHSKDLVNIGVILCKMASNFKTKIYENIVMMAHMKFQDKISKMRKK